MKKENFHIILVAAVTSFVVTVVAAVGVFGYLLNQNQTSGELRLPTIVRSGGDEDRVIEVVRAAQPAVVSITVSKNVPILERFYESGPFDDFFGFSLPLPSYREKGTEKREVGGGSGFLISADGYIVTNRHVVEDQDAEYTVFTNDGQKHEAKIVAVDPVLDLAVIKISGNRFPYLEFGDSDKLEVGQSAVAIGNALGEFRNTVSVGVISGLARSITAGDPLSHQSESLEEVIQTDAAINRGNSGGPLLDLTGLVIGVNVAVAAGSENIGFALPANSIKAAVASARASGRIVRPYLGIRYVTVTPELKEKNHLPFDYGVLVSRGKTDDELAVIPGSPANQVGIVENDLILELDGVKLGEDKSLVSLLAKRQVGEEVSLKVWHRGVTKTLRVKLMARPS